MDVDGYFGEAPPSPDRRSQQAPIAMDISDPTTIMNLPGEKVPASHVHFVENEASYLGGGGFGTVYRGAWKTLPVAVKRINAQGNPTTRASFETEVLIWNRMRHTNTFQLLAHCCDPLLLISEIADGGTMQSNLATHGWNLELGLRYLLDVAFGMEYLHHFGIRHLDLKFANVLIHRGIAMVADFGFSRIRTDPNVSSYAGPDIGTPGYKAPEVYRNAGCKASDVFSHGLMGFQVLNEGSGPFQEMRRDVSTLLWIRRFYDPNSLHPSAN
jgi:serine/threonine protein kinase